MVASQIFKYCLLANEDSVSASENNTRILNGKHRFPPGYVLVHGFGDFVLMAPNFFRGCPTIAFLGFPATWYGVGGVRGKAGRFGAKFTPSGFGPCGFCGLGGFFVFYITHGSCPLNAHVLPSLAAISASARLCG